MPKTTKSYVVCWSPRQLANMPKDDKGNPVAPVGADGKPVWVFRQGDRAWFDGDAFDGDAKEPLRRGFLREA